MPFVDTHCHTNHNSASLCWTLKHSLLWRFNKSGATVKGISKYKTLCAYTQDNKMDQQKRKLQYSHIRWDINKWCFWVTARRKATDSEFSLQLVGLIRILTVSYWKVSCHNVSRGKIWIWISAQLWSLCHCESQLSMLWPNEVLEYIWTEPISVASKINVQWEKEEKKTIEEKDQNQ